MEKQPQTNQHMFVDEHINIQVGSAAKRALETVTDEQYLTKNDGIISVSRNRWQTAQSYERRTWMVDGSHSTQDRNLDHFNQFDGYRSISGLDFAHAIELGCGPFTNLRYIMRSCQIKKCSLLDPLAETYLKHNHCNYTKTLLRGDQTVLNASLSRTIVHRGVRRVIRKIAPGLLSAIVPVEEILSKPIEEMPVQVKYDLIVIINVIEHCYDANLIFEKIKAMANQGAILVFHDKYYYHERVSEDVKRFYDAGHPLRVDRRVVDDFLDSTFSPLFKKVGKKESSLAGVDLDYDSLYFIGKLRD